MTQPEQRIQSVYYSFQNADFLSSTVTVAAQQGNREITERDFLPHTNKHQDFGPKLLNSSDSTLQDPWVLAYSKTEERMR